MKYHSSKEFLSAIMQRNNNASVFVIIVIENIQHNFELNVDAWSSKTSSERWIYMRLSVNLSIFRLCVGKCFKLNFKH